MVLQCPEHFAAYHRSWQQHDLLPDKVHCFFPSFHFHCLPATSSNIFHTADEALIEIHSVSTITSYLITTMEYRFLEPSREMKFG